MRFSIDGSGEVREVYGIGRRGWRAPGRWVAVVVSAVLLAASGACGRSGVPAAVRGGAAAVPAALPVAPPFTVRDVEGRTVSVPAGKPTVLLFGAASGCADCAVTEQEMAEVYGRYRERVQFVTVDVLPGDTGADVREFARALGAPWPHVLGAAAGLVTLYRVTSLDTVYVLDGQGHIVARSDGGLPAQELDRLLRGLVGGPGATAA
jgi:cytochrome oxidase Cu insertion factor (SCO1/SenC/PrrC family)